MKWTVYTGISRVAVAMLAAATLGVLAPHQAGAQVSVGVSVSVGTPPPPIPVYQQPPVPGQDYIWTPGYWAWGPAGYYWIPGTWVLPPQPGLLWTPGYWAWNGAAYIWSPGYWASTVGFYGGINYGFGYFGTGYVGGRWDHGHFRYNTAVTRVNTRVVRNVYVDKTVVVNRPRSAQVSYDGGRGGRPMVSHPAGPPARERRPMTQVQVEHQRTAARQHQPSHGHAPPPQAGHGNGTGQDHR